MLIPIDAFTDHLRRCQTEAEAELAFEKFTDYLDRAYMQHLITTATYEAQSAHAGELVEQRIVTLKG